VYNLHPLNSPTSITINVTGRHRGPKASGWLQSTVTTTDRLQSSASLKRTLCPKHHHYNARHMLRCIFIVECGIAFSLRYVSIRSSGIILIPEATFVPNSVSFAASVPELVHGEKSRTQSITQSITHQLI